MTACLRESDTVARIGGDEFLILLPNLVAADNAGSVAASLIESLSAPYDVYGKQVSIGASVGIAVYPDHSSTSAELRRKADGAMYEAKRQGKGSYRYAQADAMSKQLAGDGASLPRSRLARTSAMAGCRRSRTAASLQSRRPATRL